MSQVTTNRIPKGLRGLLQVYEHSCDRNSLIQDSYIRSFLNKQTYQHRLFIQSKILQNRFKLSYSDFPPMQHRMVRSLFPNQYQYDELESYGIDDLFNPEYNQSGLEHKEIDSTTKQSNKPNVPDNSPVSDIKLPRIVSTRNSSVNKYPSYHANLLKSLAAHLNPRKHVPQNITYQNIYRWFNRLLNYTPVVIILRQPQRLLSNASINQINYPYSNFNYQVEELKKTIENTESHPVTRSYHLTQLIDTDIFELAIKSKLEYSKNQLFSQRNPFDVKWNRYGTMYDRLCKVLAGSKNIQFLHNNEICHEDPEEIFTEPYLESTFKLLETNQVGDFFPYDLSYNDFHLLTIESPILHSDHSELMDLLQITSDFEVLAVRLDLNNPMIQNALTVKNDSSESSGGYQHLLDSIHSTPASNVDKLVQFFGEVGLTKADYGFDRDSMYLTRPDL